MTIKAQVYDGDNAFSVFEIQQQVVVMPDLSVLNNLINNLQVKDTSFLTNKILNECSFLPTLQEIQMISSLLNEQSLSDKLGLILNGSGPIFPQNFGPLSNFSGVIPVKNLIIILNLDHNEIIILKTPTQPTPPPSKRNSPKLK